MINIRPVSDLRNKFPELEKTVMESNEPIFPHKERLWHRWSCCGSTSSLNSKYIFIGS